jgi:uncharacterized membrane protein
MQLGTLQDWRLVVGGHLSDAWVAALCGGAVLALALSAWGLWRGPRRGHRGFMLALRAFAIGCCLLVALEPAIELRQVTRIHNHVAILVDGSRSMTVEPPDGGPSRRKRAGDLIAGASGLFARWQAQGHRVDLHAFGEDLKPTTAAALATAEPTEATRIGEALGEIKSRYAGRDLGAVVVISDGIDTGRIGPGPVDGDTQRVIEELGVPIHSVLIGEESLKDLSIASVLADDFAFVRTPITLEAVVKHSGLGNRQIEVTLTRDGKLLDARGVVLEGTGSEVKVSFPLTPQQPGQFVFEIATPVLAGEALASNNRQVFTLKVIRDRVRVLHVVGRPSWDERFVRSLLRLDPNVDLVSFFILRTDRSDRSMNQSELSLIPFPHREIFSEQLQSFDLLIFQNFDYGPYQVGSYLPGVRDYVLNGGALAMVGGDLSFASGRYGHSVLSEVLPVELDGIPEAGEGAFHADKFKPRLSDEGRTHPITSQSLDPKTNEKRWAALPALEGLNRVTRVRPGATTLLEHPRHTTVDGKPAPVLAVSDVGKGRTLALTTDTSWHWGFLDAGAGGDGRAFQRFWEAAVRWLVRDPALTLLRMDLDKVEYRKGQVINLRVRTLHADYTRAPEVDVALSVLDASQSDRDAPIKRLDARTSGEGEAHLELADLPTGAFRIVAEATIDGRKIIEEKTLVVRPEGRELEDVVARPAVLQELARLGDGVYRAGELGDVKVRPLREERIGRDKAFDIGGHPVLLALALVFLSLEWALRRRAGHR